MNSESGVDSALVVETLAGIQAVAAKPGVAIETKIRRMLRISIEAFGFPVAYVTEIDEESQRIVTAVGTHEQLTTGRIDPLSNTYCRKTIEQEAPVVVANAPAEGWATDPAYESFGLSCYVGGRVTAGDELFGTVCFADEEPRADLATDPLLETAVSSIARIIGYELQRERATDALAEREQRLALFRRAADQVGHAVIITDREGTITYVNEAFEHQTGYSATEAVGLNPRILKSGVQSVAFYDSLWETICSGERWHADIVNRRKSGELYRVDQEITPITTDDGTITNFIAVQTDVTLERLRDQQRAVLNRLLRHNLRTGANLIEGYTALLGDDVSEPDRTAHLDAINAEIERLATLSEKATTVRRLFDQGLSTGQAYEPRSRFEELQSAFADQYPAANLEIQIPASVYVQADERLDVALAELVDNAVAHSDHDEPRVVLRAVPSRLDRAGEWVDVIVADDGPGIPATERSTIESGEETPLQHGSGLGLWIAYWAVSLLGGEVTIGENEPRGSRVVLTVPQARHANE